MKRVIAIAPHPDDEIIGCGGALLKHIDQGDRVFIVFITNGEIKESNDEYEDQCIKRKNEAVMVAKEAGFEILYWSDIPARKLRENFIFLQNDLIKIFRNIKPHIIYVPHEEEKDNDHALTFQITKEAYWLSKMSLKNHPVNIIAAHIRGYEVWTPLNNIHLTVNVTSFIEHKKELIAMYESQMQHMNYVDGILGLNKYRAAFNGVEGYLESFNMISI